MDLRHAYVEATAALDRLNDGDITVEAKDAQPIRVFLSKLAQSQSGSHETTSSSEGPTPAQMLHYNLKAVEIARRKDCRQWFGETGFVELICQKLLATHEITEATFDVATNSGIVPFVRIGANCVAETESNARLVVSAGVFTHLFKLLQAQEPSDHPVFQFPLVFLSNLIIMDPEGCSPIASEIGMLHHFMTQIIDFDRCTPLLKCVRTLIPINVSVLNDMETDTLVNFTLRLLTWIHEDAEYDDEGDAVELLVLLVEHGLRTFNCKLADPRIVTALRSLITKSWSSDGVYSVKLLTVASALGLNDEVLDTMVKSDYVTGCSKWMSNIINESSNFPTDEIKMKVTMIFCNLAHDESSVNTVLSSNYINILRNWLDYLYKYFASSEQALANVHLVSALCMCIGCLKNVCLAEPNAIKVMDLYQADASALLGKVVELYGSAVQLVLDCLAGMRTKSGKLPAMREGAVTGVYTNPLQESQRVPLSSASSIVGDTLACFRILLRHNITPVWQLMSSHYWNFFSSVFSLLQATYRQLNQSDYLQQQDPLGGATEHFFCTGVRLVAAMIRAEAAFSDAVTSVRDEAIACGCPDWFQRAMRIEKIIESIAANEIEQAIKLLPTASMSNSPASTSASASTST